MVSNPGKLSTSLVFNQFYCHFFIFFAMPVNFECFDKFSTIFYFFWAMVLWKIDPPVPVNKKMYFVKWDI